MSQNIALKQRKMFQLLLEIFLNDNKNHNNQSWKKIPNQAMVKFGLRA